MAPFDTWLKKWPKLVKDHGMQKSPTFGQRDGSTIPNSKWEKPLIEPIIIISTWKCNKVLWQNLICLFTFDPPFSAHKVWKLLIPLESRFHCLEPDKLLFWSDDNFFWQEPFYKKKLGSGTLQKNIFSCTLQKKMEKTTEDRWSSWNI